jgi:hypothetical protein
MRVGLSIGNQVSVVHIGARITADFVCDHEPVLAAHDPDVAVGVVEEGWAVVHRITIRTVAGTGVVTAPMVYGSPQSRQLDISPLMSAAIRSGTPLNEYVASTQSPAFD